MADKFDSVSISGVIANTEVITRSDHLVLGADGYIYSANDATPKSQGTYLGKQYGQFTNEAETLTGDAAKKVAFTMRGLEKGVAVTGASRANVGKPVYVTGATGAQTFTMTAGIYTKVGVLQEYRSATDCDILYQSEIVTEEPGTKKIITVAAAYTATLDDDVIIANGNAAIVPVTLPAVASCVGKEYTIKAIDITNACTVVPDGAETIDGATPYTFLAANESITIKNNGTTWYIL